MGRLVGVYRVQSDCGGAVGVLGRADGRIGTELWVAVGVCAGGGAGMAW